MSVRNDSGLGPDSVPSGTTRTSVRNAVEAAQRYLLSIQAAGRPLVRRARGRHDPRVRVRPDACTSSAAPARRASARPPSTCAASSCPAAAGRSTRAGPAEVSSSVKAYFVLKLDGRRPERAAHGPRARDDPGARRHRGLQLLHADLSRDLRPVHLGRLPGRAAGDRAPARLVRLQHLQDVVLVARASSCRCRSSGRRKPFCPVPDYAAIPELHIAPRRSAHVAAHAAASACWRAFFTRIDRMLQARSRRPAHAAAQASALAACEKWIHERLVKSDGLGAIFPPIINTIIAFRCLGYALDDPRLLAQVRELEKLELEDEETLHVQPCFSPVWDTALVIDALSRRRASPADDPALLQGRALAARPGGQEGRRLEEGLPRGRARAAGTSSTPTSGTPTPTTPPRC